MKPYAFGIDIGGTTVKCGFFNSDGTFVDKWEIPTRKEDNGSMILPDIADSIKAKLAEHNVSLADVEGIGVGVPGPVLDKGVVNGCVNLGWGVFNVAEKLSDLMGGIYVEAGNDANVAALGEQWLGGGKGHQNVVMVTLGTGVGGGIIINGKIYSGSNFAGAELGHMVIVKDGKECACGRHGCWETYASATGLINLTKQKILSEKLEFSYMLKLCDGDINKVSGKTSFDAMSDGDPTAKAVVEEYISYLSCGLVNIINIFQPDVLCIGGGISAQGENLLGPVRQYVERERYTKHNDKQTVICACTLGNDAGIIGAAYLD